MNPIIQTLNAFSKSYAAEVTHLSVIDNNMSLIVSGVIQTPNVDDLFYHLNRMSNGGIRYMAVHHISNDILYSQYLIQVSKVEESAINGIEEYQLTGDYNVSNLWDMM